MVSGRLLVPGTGGGSEGPDTGLKPRPWSQSRKRQSLGPAPPCSVAGAPPGPPCLLRPMDRTCPALSPCEVVPRLGLSLHSLSPHRRPERQALCQAQGWGREQGRGSPVWDEAPRKLCCWHNQMEPCDLRPKAASPHPPACPGPRPSLASCQGAPSPAHCSPWFLFTCSWRVTGPRWTGQQGLPRTLAPRLGRARPESFSVFLGEVEGCQVRCPFPLTVQSGAAPFPCSSEGPLIQGGHGRSTTTAEWSALATGHPGSRGAVGAGGWAQMGPPPMV